MTADLSTKTRTCPLCSRAFTVRNPAHKQTHCSLSCAAKARVDPNRPEKRCARCGQMRTRAEFGGNRRKPDGLSVYCRSCKAADERQRWAANPAHYNALGRRSRLKQRYGLTPEKLADMIEERDGLCDICGRRPSSRLHVDHDHATGKVRCLLCGECNRALGLFGDTADGLRRALAYLELATWDLTPLERAVLAGRGR